MKTVRRFANLAEAGFSKSLLEAAGLRTYLAGEDNYTIGYGVGTGELLLQVEDEHFEHALRVLKEGPDAEETVESTGAAGDLPVNRELPVAPTNSGDVSRFPKGLFVAIGAGLVVLLLVVPKVIEERRKRGTVSSEKTYEFDYDRDGRADHFLTYTNDYLKRATWIVTETKMWTSGMSMIRKERRLLYRRTTTSTGKLTSGLSIATECPRPPKRTRISTGTRIGSRVTRMDCRRNRTAFPTAMVPPSDARFVVRACSKEEWVDDDRDGKFDTKYTFDPFGTRSGPMPIRAGK